MKGFKQRVVSLSERGSPFSFRDFTFTVESLLETADLLSMNSFREPGTLIASRRTRRKVHLEQRHHHLVPPPLLSRQVAHTLRVPQTRAHLRPPLLPSMTLGISHYLPERMVSREALKVVLSTHHPRVHLTQLLGPGRSFLHNPAMEGWVVQAAREGLVHLRELDMV